MYCIYLHTGTTGASAADATTALLSDRHAARRPGGGPGDGSVRSFAECTAGRPASCPPLAAPPTVPNGRPVNSPGLADEKASGNAGRARQRWQLGEQSGAKRGVGWMRTFPRVLWGGSTWRLVVWVDRKRVVVCRPLRTGSPPPPLPPPPRNLEPLILLAARVLLFSGGWGTWRW